jgi:hypothetical protein
MSFSGVSGGVSNEIESSAINDANLLSMTSDSSKLMACIVAEFSA